MDATPNRQFAWTLLRAVRLSASAIDDVVS